MTILIRKPGRSREVPGASSGLAKLGTGGLVESLFLTSQIVQRHKFVVLMMALHFANYMHWLNMRMHAHMRFRLIMCLSELTC